MATQRIALAAEANNAFGLQLYRSIQSELGPEENVFFSPLSIYTALGMTYLGTRGNTAKQMEVTMKLGPLGTKRFIMLSKISTPICLEIVILFIS